jgi:hypothetical protein
MPRGMGLIRFPLHGGPTGLENSSRGLEALRPSLSAGLPLSWIYGFSVFTSLRLPKQKAHAERHGLDKLPLHGNPTGLEDSSRGLEALRPSLSAGLP